MPESGAQGERVLSQTPLDGVKQVIAVSSCKGGVGKSTVATNLALALAAQGKKVGLADVDIYGPSAPTMLGVGGQPQPDGNEKIPPLTAHGIEVMSMGFFLDDAAPVIWRGPMAMSATKQFVRGVSWGGLDYLVVDLPPGTGDILLTLSQEIPIDGAVVVTTPQDVALADVTRGIGMFRKVNTPVLGVVVNMASLVCSGCGTRDAVFGTRTGAQLATELGVPLLGELPVEIAVREAGDAGVPVFERDPDHAASQEFAAIAGRVVDGLAAAAELDTTPEPLEIAHDKERDLVRIRWTDGGMTYYQRRGLRGWCPCAQCQGHGGQRNFVDIDDPRLSGVESVGRYAIRFMWEDGHSTGIYPYGYLLEIAEFPECRPD